MHVIRIYHSPEEAYTALSLLQAYGKSAQILDSATLSVLPLDSVALGGYRLAVPIHEAEESLDLLGDPASSLSSSPPSSDKGQQYFGDQFEEKMARTPSIKERWQKLMILVGLVTLIFLIIFGSTGWHPITWLF